jgi:hypothetical protein
MWRASPTMGGYRICDGQHNSCERRNENVTAPTPIRNKRHRFATQMTLPGLPQHNPLQVAVESLPSYVNYDDWMTFDTIAQNTNGFPMSGIVSREKAFAHSPA